MVIRSRGLVINKQREGSSKYFYQGKKKVFTKCFGDMRSHNWISGVQSRARHGNSNGNRGNILLTECLKNYGQAQHWSSCTVWGCTCDSQLHRGRHQQLRTSQGHGPNWQGHLQFWFSKTSFHTSLPSLLSSIGHSSYNLQGIYCFFFFFLMEVFCFSRTHMTWGSKATLGIKYNRQNLLSLADLKGICEELERKGPNTNIYFTTLSLKSSFCPK